MIAMIAPHALDAFYAFTKPWNAEVLLDSSARVAGDAEGPAAQLRADLEPHDACGLCASIPSITYLQVRYGDELPLEQRCTAFTTNIRAS